MSLRADGCVRTAGGPVKAVASTPAPAREEPQSSKPKEVLGMARVGKEAPDFVAPAYFAAAFKDFKLSDYRGKWVLLCFYPGDFTFV